LDYDREVAIVSELKEEKNRIIGVGRVILEPGKNCGEFAVVVGDEWQGRGLGSKLMDYLIEIGKDIGLEMMYGYVSSNNPKMINLCAKKGFELKPIDEEITKATLKLS
jgi:acetyltransferase